MCVWSFWLVYLVYVKHLFGIFYRNAVEIASLFEEGLHFVHMAMRTITDRRGDMTRDETNSDCSIMKELRSPPALA